MTIPCSVKDLELKKFVESPDDSGDTAVRVKISGGSGSLISGLDYDSISVAYPIATTEVFSYYTGGLAGTLVATVTIVYTNASKDDIVSVVKT